MNAISAERGKTLTASKRHGVLASLHPAPDQVNVLLPYYLALLEDLLRYVRYLLLIDVTLLWPARFGPHF